MKYSKKVREEAALICAIAASGGVYEEHGPGVGRRVRIYLSIANAMDASRPALKLALNAYASMGGFWGPEMDAELESKLRSGWSPP
jgi:hypothetical protein